MELVSVILVLSKDVRQMVRQTSVSTNSIREGMLRLSQGSIPCCLIFIALKSHNLIVVWLFLWRYLMSCDDDDVGYALKWLLNMGNLKG